MTEGETELEMAARHVVEQESRMSMQRTLIGRLMNVGAPTGPALELLDSMQDLLVTMRAHVARLAK
jgi:hypothetical protein